MHIVVHAVSVGDISDIHFCRAMLKIVNIDIFFETDSIF